MYGEGVRKKKKVLAAVHRMARNIPSTNERIVRADELAVIPWVLLTRHVWVVDV